MSDRIFLNTRYAFRSDTLEKWRLKNPVLENGEPAIVSDGTDGEWLKIGDGIKDFNSLGWKKGPKGDKGESGPAVKVVVEQTYNPDSENAQSGKAVAEAVSEKPWTLIEDVNLTEAGTQISIPWDRLQVKELYIEGTIIPSDTSISTQTIQMGMSGTAYIQGSQNPKATGKYYVTMRVYKSPSKFTVFDGVISNYPYTSGGANFVGRSENFKGDYICSEGAKNLWVKSQTANGLGVGTKLKFWGR